MGSASVWTGITVTTPTPGIVWTDISDYVLSVGNFDQLFNNYDYSLKDCVIEIVLTNLISADLYLDPTEVKIKIVQDGKKIFVGYISETQKSEVEQTITLTVPNVIHKLFLNSFINFRVKWVAGDFDYVFDSTDWWCLTGTDNLICAIFEVFTGEVIEDNNLLFLSNRLYPSSPFYRAWVHKNALISFNTGEVQAWYEVSTRITLSEFFGLICTQGVNIFYNPNTEKFEFIQNHLVYAIPYQGNGETPVYPVDNNTYDLDIVTNIDMKKQTSWLCTYGSDLADYTNQTVPIPTDVSYHHHESMAGNEVLQWACSNLIVKLEISNGVWESQTELAGVRNFTNERFHKDIDTREYETELITDFSTNFINITGCQAVLRGDRFYSKVEFSELVL